MKILVITHFDKDDPNCYGEYCEITIHTYDGDRPRKIAEYGDWYHDKGKEKAEGFVDGIKYCVDVDVAVEHRNVADWEY